MIALSLEKLVVLLYLTVGLTKALSHDDNKRIRDSEELLSVIINKCFEFNTMKCLKMQVLNYLDTVSEIDTEEGRSFNEGGLDKQIYERVGKLLISNEFTFKLPGEINLSFNTADGFDIKVPTNEGNFHVKKMCFMKLIFLFTFLSKQDAVIC